MRNTATTSHLAKRHVKHLFLNQLVVSRAMRSKGHLSSSSNDGMLLKNGPFELWWRSDGNLVLYGPSGAVWASGTNSRCNRLAFQPDGNLVIYNNYTAVWASSTADSQHGGNGGRLLLLTADGWFSILDNYWQSVWGFDAQP